MLTPSQLKRLIVLTNRLEKYYGASKINHGKMLFKIEVLNGGNVMLSATNNNDNRWFDTWYMVQIIVGKRGGVTYFDSFENKVSEYLIIK